MFLCLEIKKNRLSKAQAGCEARAAPPAYLVTPQMVQLRTRVMISLKIEAMGRLVEAIGILTDDSQNYPGPWPLRHLPHPSATPGATQSTCLPLPPIDASE